MGIKPLIFKKDPQKILIIKPSSLGDIVHSLPFLTSVSKKFPKAEIHWMVAKGLEGILQGNPMISKLWIINKDKWKKINSINNTFSEIISLVKNLRKEKFDIIIDLQGLFRSGILTALTGSKLRLGFKDAREGSSLFYTHKVITELNSHAVEKNLKIAGFLDCPISNVSFDLPFVQNRFDISKIIPKNEKYAVIIPGARWETKKWPADRFGELASKLRLKSIIVGGEADIDVAADISKKSMNKGISIAGKTDIGDLIGIIKNSEFIVSNDTGPMHIAVALGVPVFAVFGPTNPIKTGPYGKGNFVFRAEIECLPCYKRKCKDVKCMKMIQVENVLNAIEKRFNH
ncbi:MAG: lipopolysaccharide heptosyltransferase I [Nitrospiraceae bacterium]|nr:lipopolysaccharide heptosyltransferase I [Nitrospiraceae bacterium]